MVAMLAVNTFELLNATAVVMLITEVPAVRWAMYTLYPKRVVTITVAAEEAFIMAGVTEAAHELVNAAALNKYVSNSKPKNILVVTPAAGELIPEK